MNPNARQVAIDILRELGHEDEARWLEHPDAVRELLKHDPVERIDYEEVGCAGAECGGGDPTSEYRQPHSRTCPIAAAWRALGDPRAVADIQQAHERAIDASEQEMRLVAQSKCPHHRISRRHATSGGTCLECQKWWSAADLDPVVADRKPIDWGKTPAVRMSAVERALRLKLISKEQARNLLASP